MVDRRVMVDRVDRVVVDRVVVHMVVVDRVVVHMVVVYRVVVYRVVAISSLFSPLLPPSPYTHDTYDICSKIEIMATSPANPPTPAPATVPILIEVVLVLLTPVLESE
ncbi:unnamed protein product [Sphagnum balticum]